MLSHLTAAASEVSSPETVEVSVPSPTARWIPWRTKVLEMANIGSSEPGMVRYLSLGPFKLPPMRGAPGLPPGSPMRVIT